MVRIGRDGTKEIVAGTGQPGYSGDGGPASAAQFNAPAAIAVDAQGNIYVADTGNVRIRHIDPQGMVTTIAGNGTAILATEQ